MVEEDQCNKWYGNIADTIFFHFFGCSVGTFVYSSALDCSCLIALSFLAWTVLKNHRVIISIPLYSKNWRKCKFIYYVTNYHLNGSLSNRSSPLNSCSADGIYMITVRMPFVRVCIENYRRFTNLSVQANIFVFSPLINSGSFDRALLVVRWVHTKFALNILSIRHETNYYSKSVYFAFMYVNSTVA